MGGSWPHCGVVTHPGTGRTYGDRVLFHCIWNGNDVELLIAGWIAITFFLRD